MLDATSATRVKAIVFTGMTGGNIYQFGPMTFDTCAGINSIAVSPIPSTAAAATAAATTTTAVRTPQLFVGLDCK